MLNEALRGQLDKLRAAYDPNTAPGGITLWWGGSTFPDGEKDTPALDQTTFRSSAVTWNRTPRGPARYFHGATSMPPFVCARWTG